MAKRREVGFQKSKKSFTRGAMHVHPKNVRMNSGVMRGGYRL